MSYSENVLYKVNASIHSLNSLEGSWSTCTQLPPKQYRQLSAARSQYFTWTLTKLSLKPQIYQECSIIHQHSFDSDIKNTITIFHHLWQAFESTDKPWLRYYFCSGKQFITFYSREFHFICHDTPCCILMSVKTDSEVKQAVSLIQSHIRTSAYNPTTVPKHTIQKKSQCYSCYNDHNFFYFFFLSKFVCYALYSAIEKLESPLICVM